MSVSAKHTLVCTSKSTLSAFPRNGWFDDECKMQKRVVNSSARECRCDPDCVRKEKYWRERKIYKELIRMKKRKAFNIKLSNLRTTHPREFWKVVSKAAAVHHKCIPIDMVDMAAYFQTLNKNAQIIYTFATTFLFLPRMTSWMMRFLKGNYFAQSRD